MAYEVAHLIGAVLLVAGFAWLLFVLYVDMWRNA